jgi:hypothetical protein
MYVFLLSLDHIYCYSNWTQYKCCNYSIGPAENLDIMTVITILLSEIKEKVDGRQHPRSSLPNARTFITTAPTIIIIKIRPPLVDH